MKMLIRVLVFLVLALGIVLALNFSKLQRLMTVNTLFDEDRIVENFSNMDAAFLHHDLEIGDPQPWEEDIQALPETVMIAGEKRALTDVLEELKTTALVIIKDGKLIHESYYKGTDKDDLRISWSVAKSFMSGLYGKALEAGQIENLDDPADKYVPSLKGSAYEGVSLRHILNMSSGVVFNEDYMDPKSDINDMGRVLGLGGSMDKYAATLKESYYTPGKSWQYVSIDTHVAAMALRAATGKTLHELFEETYGAHLGFGKSPFYLTDGKDVAFALGGLNLRTRDYAKFGQLFLQDGQWKGEQIIPADWVADSTKNHAPIFHPDRGTGYGYQWWIPMPQDGIHEGDFFAVGIYGQYVYVNPRLNIVIAKNAAHRTFTQNGTSGQTSIEDNIDMFRSLAEYYYLSPVVLETNIFINEIDNAEGVAQGDFGEVFGLIRVIKTPSTRAEWESSVKRILNGEDNPNLVSGMILGEIPSDLRTEEFNEKFEAARQTFVKNTLAGINSYDSESDLNLPIDGLPSSEELNEIYELMLQEIRAQGQNQK